MTIYATKHTLSGELVTIVAAGDTFAEFDQWQASNFVEEGTSSNYINAHLTEPIEHLVEPDLKKFKKPLMIFTHANEADQDSFVNEHQLSITHLFGAVDAQETMIWVAKVAAEAAKEAADRENGIRVTIGEATGTAEVDRWDTVPEETAIMAAPANVTGHGAGAHGGEGKLKKATSNKIDNSKGSDTEDEVDSVIVRGTEVDADGNVHVDIAVLDEREREQVREMRKKALEEKAKKEQEIREAAAAAGIDADAPDTYTAIESGNVVVQQNNRLKIVETVFANGHRAYRDLTTRLGVPEEQIDRLRRKREAEAQVRDIEEQERVEEEERKAAEEAKKAAQSDLRKKLERMRGGDAVEQPEQEDPKDAMNRVLGEISQAVAAGFPTSRVFEIADELVTSKQITREFADKVIGDLPVVEDNTGNISQTQERKIRRQLVDAFNLSNDIENITINPVINRNTPEKTGRQGDEYYFAVLPPGAYNTDELEAILGREAYLVVIPKKEFDTDGKVPGTDGGWFTVDELAEWENKTGISVEEIASSVYKLSCNIGDAARHFRTIGSSENGLLLTALGVSIDNIPFDWPYHYKKNGHRVTDQELRMEAVRILQIARDQGLKLFDDDGQIDATLKGVDQIAIAKTEQDITGEVKKLLGATGTTEDSRDDCELITEGNEVAFSDLPDDVKDIIRTQWSVEDIGDNDTVPVMTPAGMSFVRIEGKDFYILPEFAWEAYCRIELIGTTNLQQIKKVSVRGGPIATVYTKLDSTATAVAVYRSNEESDTPWVVAL